MNEMDPTSPGANPAASAKQMIGDAGHTVKQEAANFASQAQEKAVGEIHKRAEAGAETLGQFASAIRKAGDELAQNDQSMVSRLVVQAADGLEGFSQSLANKRPEELLDSVRDLGRRNPTAFIAGAVIAGLAIGRFMRASSPESRNLPQPYTPQPYAPQDRPPESRTYYGRGPDPAATASLGSQAGADMGTSGGSSGASSGGASSGDGASGGTSGGAFGGPGEARRFDPGV